MTGDFHFARQGRRLRTGLLVAALWLVLLAAWIWLSADPLILGVLGAFTLPALWDLIKNPTAGLTLTETTLSWQSGPRTAQIALTEIDRIRLDTRLDLSVRVMVILRSGAKVRIPPDATPSHQRLETALIARGLKTERHHFSLMQ